MRIDVVSIFPGYLDPVRLSLPGKAIASGLVDLRVHDLRDWTHDRHRTVDDSPAGGGAGMVMKPEPWGDALDELATDETVLVVPSPAGAPFTQRVAEELSQASHLVFACGRYEGIDQRVLDEAASRMTVREVSLGDYVLNGGEVAALAMTEAVVRLLPGVLGNPASLDEESHGDEGLLEHPVYTRPATWRGRDVPPVLLGGDHAAIESWRRAASLRRTTDRRPDLLHPSRTVRVGDEDLVLATATAADAGEVLTLQLACWVTEALANDSLDIPALHESLDDVRSWVVGGDGWVTFVLRAGERLVGGVRAREVDGEWDIGRLMVAPDLRGRGLGRFLLEHIEGVAPSGVERISLFTGEGSTDNLRMYRRAGYRRAGAQHDVPGAVRLTKRLSKRPTRP